MLRVLICQRVCVYMCVYYVKSVNMSRSLLFYVYIYVWTVLRVLICQGVYYFMCLCVYYVKSVNMSRSLLFHVFIYMCVYYVQSVNMSRSLLFRVFIREYGSTLYVGLARAASPTNTNFRLTFLLT